MNANQIIELAGDCVHRSANGRDRGDGYDVMTYRLRATPVGGVFLGPTAAILLGPRPKERYLVHVWQIGSGYEAWYVSDTLEGALAVGAQGYTPGSAPGRYAYVSRPERLREIRAALTARRQAIARLRGAAEDESISSALAEGGKS